MHRNKTNYYADQKEHIYGSTRSLFYTHAYTHNIYIDKRALYTTALYTVGEVENE